MKLILRRQMDGQMEGHRRGQRRSFSHACYHSSLNAHLRHAPRRRVWMGAALAAARKFIEVPGSSNGERLETETDQATSGGLRFEVEVETNSMVRFFR